MSEVDPMITRGRSQRAVARRCERRALCLARGGPTVLGAVTRRWAHSGTSIEIGHLLYECVHAALIKATPLVAIPCDPRPVLPKACRRTRPGWRPLDLDPGGVLSGGLGPAADELGEAVR